MNDQHPLQSREMKPAVIPVGDFPYMMAMGDGAGTVHKVTVEQAKELLPEFVGEAERMRRKIDLDQQINMTASTMVQTSGVRQTVKALASKLKVIQEFNTAVTGDIKPIIPFFPDALALVQFYLHRHLIHGKHNISRFVPITRDHREVFIGVTKLFSGENVNV